MRISDWSSDVCSSDLLSSFFDGVTAEELALAEGGWFAEHGIELALGEPATELDTEAKVVTTATGRRIEYEACVLASGSSAFVPPIDGHDADRKSTRLNSSH